MIINKSCQVLKTRHAYTVYVSSSVMIRGYNKKNVLCVQIHSFVHFEQMFSAFRQEVKRDLQERSGKC